MSEVKCPHCEKVIETTFFDIAHRNVEQYGDKGFVFRCPYCNKKFRIYIVRQTRVQDVSFASNDKDLSFG